jgi:methylated-DNA-[protein]-cysteine S-methyltransferase
MQKHVSEPIHQGTHTRTKASHKIVYIAEIDPSPLGPIRVALSEQGLLAVDFSSDRTSFEIDLKKRGFKNLRYDPEAASQAVREILEYLQGRRKEFTIPVDWSEMTSFQVQALRETMAIPFGQVSTYGEIALRIGKPRAARAVGRAEATNPMPLVIPCHRVIGRDGKLHGYGGRGGLQTKAWLLELEGYKPSGNPPGW